MSKVSRFEEFQLGLSSKNQSCLVCARHYGGISDGRTRQGQAAEAAADQDALFEEIGRLKVELDFVKKEAGMLE